MQYENMKDDWGDDAILKISGKDYINRSYLKGEITMTNLSKELCEICGIEPKWIKYETETTDGCINLGSKKVYPDFEQPENFVRLLNLPTEIIKKNGQEFSAKSIWWIVNMDAKDYNALAPYYFDDLLIRLIVILENKNKKYSSEFLCKIKQAIREAEWVYE